MRLHSAIISGFKSFVEKTTLSFPSQITAIVGPNGCGKSNIIDAIRWVMGESSATQLRGDSLADVIFNGSASRKPLSHASIELIFDNSDGKLGGEYKTYAHISVCREISREGQSTYYLNKTRCRRRDIVDIFLGTGLGPRSYGIIEQGMINRIVGAKPEELRTYIEEAAGITKYKERKRETEDRIEKAQENINRLNDIQEEVQRQLTSLQKQVDAAQYYKTLKNQERLLKAQIRGRKCKQLKEALHYHAEQLANSELEQNNLLNQEKLLHQQAESLHKQYLKIHQSTESLKIHHHELEKKLTRQQEVIKNAEEQQIRQTLEILEVDTQIKALKHTLENLTITEQTINVQFTKVNQAYKISEETLNSINLKLLDLQKNFTYYQAQWETLNQKFTAAQQEKNILINQIHSLESQLPTFEKRIHLLQAQQKTFNQQLIDLKGQDCSLELLELINKKNILKNTHENLISSLIGAKTDLAQQIKSGDKEKTILQTLYGHLSSLKTLQKEALGQQGEKLKIWLEKMGEKKEKRLLQLIDVEEKWQKAAEIVLNPYFESIYLENSTLNESYFQHFPPCDASFIIPYPVIVEYKSHLFPTLLSKIKSSYPLENLLSGILVCEEFSEALAVMSQLSNSESIITREGIWVGKGWIRLFNGLSSKSGILEREKEISSVQHHLVMQEEKVKQQQSYLFTHQEKLHTLEDKLKLSQQQLTELINVEKDVQMKEQMIDTQQKHLIQQLDQVNQSLNEYETDQLRSKNDLKKNHELLQIALITFKSLDVETASLFETKSKAQLSVNEITIKYKDCQSAFHQVALQRQALESEAKSISGKRQEINNQLVYLKKQEERLHLSQKESENPLSVLKNEFTENFNLKNEAESHLQEFQQQLKLLEDQSNTEKTAQLNCQELLKKQQKLIEKFRLEHQEILIHTQTLSQQLEEEGYSIESIIEALSEESEPQNEEADLQKIYKKLEKIGIVNLLAQQEYEGLNERKLYLESQAIDLQDALSLLENAIKKMDKETLDRFTQTFNQVNDNFKKLFPRLFGGGNACLLLSDQEEILQSGVSIKAQPPGKKNNNIHLLSGGEKALTALALVFSFFQLNPAPFCILDEVDAPLDDANVIRFCNLVKFMAPEIQFIFISHNKLAMEMATHLIGVTMNEPGVSRIVAVDIEKSIALISS